MPDQNKVNILGTYVIRPEVEEAVRISLSSIRDPGQSMIYFLTAESSLLCQTDADAAEFVNQCDLVLPGDLHTEKAFYHLNPDEDGRESDGQYTQDYMNRLFEAMNENELSIYTVMDSEETLTDLQEYILTEYPGVNLDGILVEKDSEGEFGRVVNDINTCVPDIVFICLPPDLQIRFVGGFSQMMNTGLCICIESMQPWLHKETVEIPGFFRAIGASGFYLWLKKKGKFHRLVTGSLFRKQVRTEAGEAAEEKQDETAEENRAEAAEEKQDETAEENCAEIAEEKHDDTAEDRYDQIVEELVGEMAKKDISLEV